MAVNRYDGSRAWYAISTYSGYEDKVADSIKQRIGSVDLADKIFDAIVPKEKQIEIKNGKRRVADKKIFQGYVLVEMCLSDETWYIIRNTPGVTGFVGTGTLSQATKAQFDAIVENVSAANNGADVVIMGSKSALSKISALADVYWAAAGQKDNVMYTGNIGIYEGTRLVTIPNRFKDKTFTTKVFPSNVLMIFPAIGEAGKFVKFVDEGDTEILEKTERGDYTSDIQTYEVQRRFGVATVIGRQFGQWTL